MSRARKLTPEKLEEYIELLRSGKSKVEAAKIIGVHRQTMVDHEREHPEFTLEIEKIQDDLIDMVEARLYRLCVGGQSLQAMKYFLEHSGRERWTPKCTCGNNKEKENKDE